MKLPQLPSEPVRFHTELEEVEIYQPSWACFCCEDRGIVTPLNARLVIPDYNYDRDRLPICQADGCSKSDKWSHLGHNNLDIRFTSAICCQLDKHSREDWRRTTERKSIDIRTMAKKLSMGGISDRTLNDNREVQQRCEEIKAISSEQWLAMKDEHRRSKKDEVS